MRRQVIPPIYRVPVRVAQGEAGSLDMARGAGRTLHQLSRAHPGHRYFGVVPEPTSPWNEARDLLRGRSVSLLVDNAEAMPLKDRELRA